MDHKKRKKRTTRLVRMVRWCAMTLALRRKTNECPPVYCGHQLISDRWRSVLAFAPPSVRVQVTLSFKSVSFIQPSWETFGTILLLLICSFAVTPSRLPVCLGFLTIGMSILQRTCLLSVAQVLIWCSNRLRIFQSP